jgi:2-polyprenyl-3-methyl-5-hydroxy-6-metoxy-1,4-benzoquinol methylase
VSGSAQRASAATVDGTFVEWNETMAERYDIERYYERSHSIVRWLERQRLDAIVDLAGPIVGRRVLEVGCGAGHVLERFKGALRTGIDLSNGMLSRIRRRLGVSVDLARGSGDGLPFAPGSFDVVVCTEVLEHVPDPAAVVAELVRVAGPDGRVVVSIPNEVNIDRAKRVLRSLPIVRSLLRTLASEDNEWHLHRFDLKMLNGIVAGRARIEKLVAIPSRALPLRYVALLRADDRGRAS